MPRQLRIAYPGAIYHVMNSDESRAGRGDRREPIFQDDAQPTRPELVSKVRSDPFMEDAEHVGQKVAGGQGRVRGEQGQIHGEGRGVIALRKSSRPRIRPGFLVRLRPS